jgi:hypothetical protein
MLPLRYPVRALRVLVHHSSGNLSFELINETLVPDFALERGTLVRGHPGHGEYPPEHFAPPFMAGEIAALGGNAVKSAEVRQVDQHHVFLDIAGIAEENRAVSVGEIKLDPGEPSLPFLPAATG